MKPRLAIVLPDDVNPRVLKVFEPLGAEFEISVYALSSSMINNFQNLPFRAFLFEAVTDMPGYMRHLDDHLSSMDVIIGVGTANLSSFQALRIALKFKRPFIALSTDYIPDAYRDYPNVRAIQADILQRSQMIISLCQKTTATLEAHEVSRDMIREVPPSIEMNRFKYSEDLRAKFRSHIGATGNAVVGIIRGPVLRTSRIDEVFQAIKVLKTRNAPNIENLRLLIVGDGDAAQDLKYKASDLGVAQNVMFLHQDPEPFLPDLYSSADFCIQIRPTPQALQVPDPFFAWEMACSGVTPIVTAGLPCEPALRPHAVSINDDSFSGIADALGEFLSRSPAETATRKQELREHCLQYFDKFHQAQSICIEILSCLTKFRNESPTSFDTRKNIQAIHVQMRNGALQEALVAVEDLILRTHSESSDYGSLLLTRGDIFAKASRYEEAMESYQGALQIDRENSAALRGLGYMAFKVHAYEESLTFFRRALSSQNDDVESMTGIGLVYKKLKLTEEALQWLSKALERKNDHSIAMSAIAQTCIEAPNSRRVTQALEILIESVGDHGPLLMALGQLYLNQGRPEEGNAIIERALALDSQTRKSAA